MTGTRDILPAGRETRVARLATGLFEATLAAAIVIALLLVFLPGPAFLAISNYLQVFVAIAGAVALLLYRGHCTEKRAPLIAAAGIGLWGISNIAWYATVFAGMRAAVFPSIIDLGMIASFVVLAFAFQAGFPRSGISPWVPVAILALSFLAGAVLIAFGGVSPATFLCLLYFLACGFLFARTLEYGGEDRNPALVAGSFLLAMAFVIYPLREMFFVQVVVLSAIGTFVSAGFSLIVIGWIADGTP